MTSSTFPVLAVRQLSIVLRQADAPPRRVVNQVSFEIQPGEVLALVGESGSGKTMIGRAILQLLPQVASIGVGSIRFDGQELVGAGETALRSVRGRGIGMVFQEPMVSLNPALSIGYQMTEALRLHLGLDLLEAKRRCLDMLERVRIADPVACFAAYPHQFSGGMRQRIMLASVLVMQPRLLLADEPTTALDAIIQKEVMEIMLSLTREIGTAVLLVSHDLGMVAHYADRVLVMRKGEALEEGATDAVLLAPRHEYTRALLDALPACTDEAARKIGAPLVEVRGLSIDFHSKPALFWQKRKTVRAVDSVDLTLRQGETVAVVGESGSGKTTIGRTLVRLVAESAGSIKFDGREVTRLQARELAAYRLQTQMVFQDPFSSLDPRMCLRDIVAEGLRMVPNLTSAARAARAETMLGEVGLGADYAGRFPHELSGGQRQRVCIARAIVATPRLVVADEPVSALDVTVQKQILALLARLQQKFGFTYLFISHDLGVVEQVADRVVVMYRGRILEAGPRAAIYGAPCHPYTIRLLQATPRIRRDGNGFRLAMHVAQARKAPDGYRYFNHGSIPGEPRSAGVLEMLAVADNHLVACCKGEQQ